MQILINVLSIIGLYLLVILAVIGAICGICWLGGRGSFQQPVDTDPNHNRRATDRPHISEHHGRMQFHGFIDQDIGRRREDETRAKFLAECQ